MRNRLIFTIVFTLIVNNVGLGDSSKNCDDASLDKQLIAQCEAYAKSLEIKVTDRDNKIKLLSDQHNKDVDALKSSTPATSPVVAFLLGAGSVLALAGLLSIYAASKK